MRANKFVVPALVIGLLLGTVAVAQANGWWIVSGKEMVGAGNLQSADDIKGWMSFQQVADGFGIDVAALYAQLDLPADLPPSTALKEMEAIIPGFEVTTVRDVVTSHLGASGAPAAEAVELPAAPVAAAGTEDATTAAADALPRTAVTPVPKAAATATPTPEATPEAADHTPAGDGTGLGAGDGSGEGVAVIAGGLNPADIKGRHTLAEIAEGTGVPLAALLAALELDADTDPATQVRELVEGGTLDEIDAVRTVVVELQATR